ncbi:hypothetical protein FQR65_LT14649 [Abscondita terminalis]|nr:hypothetical protein FQR65_LT14649 [Abscondita terminalis]
MHIGIPTVRLRLAVNYYTLIGDSSMPQNVTQKLINLHKIEGELHPGTEIGLKIDQTLCQDATDLQDMANKLKNIIHELGEEIEKTETTVISQKKKLLEYIALLMLAPIHVRPDAKELEKKADCEFNQLLSYQQWAENYIEQWKTFLPDQSMTDNVDLQDMANKLKNIIHELGEEIEKTETTVISQKKKLLEYIALLMLAPIHVRPDAKELESIMKNISFVIHKESETFYSDHLTKNNNYLPTIFQLQTNNYVVVSESTMNMKRSP